eukprot:16769-Heterococcus_DN1.PRE.2
MPNCNLRTAYFPYSATANVVSRAAGLARRAGRECRHSERRRGRHGTNAAQAWARPPSCKPPPSNIVPTHVAVLVLMQYSQNAWLCDCQPLAVIDVDVPELVLVIFALTLLHVCMHDDRLQEDWPAAGEDDDKKKGLLAQAKQCDEKYPGGLTAYITKARKLLKDSAEGVNPFDGYTPELSLPVEVTTRTTYLNLYVHYILELQKRARAAGGNDDCRLPLIIMTSEDTDKATKALLLANDNFGMAAEQISALVYTVSTYVDGPLACRTMLLQLHSDLADAAVNCTSLRLSATAATAPDQMTSSHWRQSHMDMVMYTISCTSLALLRHCSAGDKQCCCIEVMLPWQKVCAHTLSTHSSACTLARTVLAANRSDSLLKCARRFPAVHCLATD